MERQFQIVDRTLASLVAVLDLIISVGWHLPENLLLAPLLLGAGMIPPLLLWLSTRLSMGLLIFYSLMCCQGAYVMCDIGPGDPWGVLHVAHHYLWLLCPYAIIRLTMKFFVPPTTARKDAKFTN